MLGGDVSARGGGLQSRGTLSPMNVKQIARWIGVCVSVASVLVAILTYLGVWNEWRGDNLLAEVATRFDSSYSQDAGRPVRASDKRGPSS